MKNSRIFYGIIVGLAAISITSLLINRTKPKHEEVVAPSNGKMNQGLPESAPLSNSQEQGKTSLSPTGHKPHALAQFQDWVKKVKAPVTFVNPPVPDKEGLFCVINPEYQFGGKKITEFVEDGYWYSHALTGPRGAILIGKGNGRPPWSYKIGELFIDDHGQLQFLQRVSFGGNKGVLTRMLLDLDEKSAVTKIGIAMDDLDSGTPWGYPPVVYGDVVITSEEVERLPLVPLKSNWVQLDTNFNPDETLQRPVRVIWLQFQDRGKKIVRIDN